MYCKVKASSTILGILRYNKKTYSNIKKIHVTLRSVTLAKSLETHCFEEHGSGCHCPHSPMTGLV